MCPAVSGPLRPQVPSALSWDRMLTVGLFYKGNEHHLTGRLLRHSREPEVTSLGLDAALAVAFSCLSAPLPSWCRGPC